MVLILFYYTSTKYTGKCVYTVYLYKDNLYKHIS